MVFALLCNWSTFSCFNTELFFFKKKKGERESKKTSAFGLLLPNHTASLLTTKRKLGVAAIGLIPTVS